MVTPIYPATSNQQAIDLNISNANQFFTILQGGIEDFIPTYEGNGEIPSVAKALNEAAAYKVPLPWQTTGEETDLLQPREFNDDIYVPLKVPAEFSTAPSNEFWRLYSEKRAQVLIDNITLTGDGFTTDFNIPSMVVDDPAAYLVSIDGVDQRPTIDYTVDVSTDTLSFTEAPPTTVANNISVTILGALRGALAEDIYETTADGLANTSDGQFFHVVNTTDPEAFIDLYRNNAGAALLIDTYPNSVAYSNLANAVAYEADLASNTVGDGSDKIAHTGTTDTVTQALDKRTIYVGSVADFPETAENGSELSLLSWHPNQIEGGGTFRFDANKPKANHDGGLNISPTVPAPSDFTSSNDVEDYLDGIGETDPSGTGIWERVHVSVVTDSMYGGRSLTGFSIAGITNRAIQAATHVYINFGTREVDSAIRIRSNRTLEFHPLSELKLQDGASDYLVTNDDLVNGNINIRIIGNGATINGNKAGGQVRNYTAPADDRSSYWGFGFWLARVTNLEVRDFYVFETEAWGVAYWSVDNAYFGNIEFSQETAGGSNGDGVTGVGSNILIENIFGYTNDDMVAIATGGGTLGGNDMGMPQLEEIRNITIQNIKPQVKNGSATWRAVRATGRSPDGGTTPAHIFGLTIKNIRGYTRQSIVDIANYWPEDPGFFIHKLVLENVEREYYPTDVDTSYAHITIGEVNIQDMTIRDWRAFDVSEIPDFCTIGPNGQIGRLKLEGCEFIDEVPSVEKALIKDEGTVTTVLINNCTGLRRNVPGSVANGRLYFKTNTTSPRTNVRFSSSYVARNYNNNNAPIDGVTGAALAVSGTSDITRKASLTPIDGDVIVDNLTFTLQTWNGSSWV